MTAATSEAPVVLSGPGAAAGVVIVVVSRERPALRVEDTTPGWSDQPDVDYIDPD